MTVRRTGVQVLTLAGAIAVTAGVVAVSHISTAAEKPVALAVTATPQRPGTPAGGQPGVPQKFRVPANATFLGEATVQNGLQIYRCVDGRFQDARPQGSLDGSIGGVDYSVQSDDPEMHVFRSVGANTPGVADRSTVYARIESPVPGDSGVTPVLFAFAGHGTIKGKLSAVTHIQRVNTGGGAAPERSCQPDETADVPFTATYRFFTTRITQ
jgi:hypothetical protein